MARIGGSNRDEAFRMGERQSLEQRPVHKRERRRRGAEAERQCSDRRQRKSRVLEEESAGEPEVLSKSLKAERDPHVARPVLCEREAAKRPTSGKPGLVRSHAGIFERMPFHCFVERQLLSQIGLEATVSKQS
jgi:hypothetical protein